MTRRLSYFTLLLLLPLAIFAAACGGDGDDGQDGAAGSGTADIEQTVRAALDAYNRQDLNAFLDYWTDNGLEAEFGGSRQEIQQAGDEFFGGPPQTIRNFRNTDVSGDSATTDVEWVIGKSLSVETFELVRQDNAWKIDGSRAQTVSVPSGTTGIDVDLEDFSFKYDASRIANGNIAFRTENVGNQPHELVLLKVPQGFDLLGFLRDQSEELPDGVEITGGIGPVDADASANLVFTEPLAAGRYMMVCFLPDEDDSLGTPHILKGMVSEFTVPGQGGGR